MIGGLLVVLCWMGAVGEMVVVSAERLGSAHAVATISPMSIQASFGIGMTVWLRPCITYRRGRVWSMSVVNEATIGLEADVSSAAAGLQLKRVPQSPGSTALAGVAQSVKTCRVWVKSPLPKARTLVGTTSYT